MHEIKIGITHFKKDVYCISLRKDGVRHRFYNGEPIGDPDKPNQLPLELRLKGFQDLLVKYQIALRAGWTPPVINKTTSSKPRTLGAEFLQRVYEDKLKENLSMHFNKDMKSYIGRMIPLVKSEITEETFQLMPDTHPHWNNTTYNNFVRYAALIEKGLAKYGYSGSWSKKAKRRRKAEVLHKKFNHVPSILSTIASFNEDLHLCALLTYGCLLRPHREVRELTWGDFNPELTTISLAGSRNKGKRNRIIPVPQYVRQHLTGGAPHHNIFSGLEQPYNPYYFSQLWQRFKKENPGTIAPGQTLYSLRHTGAIAVYEKTRNIKILQTVMGHSDMATSLTYLRGLEVNELDVAVLPDL